MSSHPSTMMTGIPGKRSSEKDVSGVSIESKLEFEVVVMV